MARWQCIKIVFDTPVPEETINLLDEELHTLDCDFPRGCLTTEDFTAYRHPTIPDADMVAVFLKHGVTGRWWMSGSDDPDHATDSDGDCVVFRPGVDPDSIADAHRARIHEDALQRDARRWANISRALQVASLPVPWEALPLLYIYVDSKSHESFEAAVQKNLTT